ncbi:MAG: DUF3793 family protein [Oscillospiraceae bacterium]|nr:DUF3793 family protein [Oscillospiraceae bacterium]
MSELERRGFEHTLAFHTAPTLLGIKCANLLSIAMDESDMVLFYPQFERRSGLRMQVLCQCRNRQLLYVYHEVLLKMQLSQPQTVRFLEQYGYCKSMTVPEMLSHLAKRMECGDFPHEIGIFLGYPLADVQGFIKNQGKNCLLCGCWKVYSNPEAAQRAFANYDRCREILCDKLRQGCEFFRALELSKEEIS